jgi:hypothetical protein
VVVRRLLAGGGKTGELVNEPVSSVVSVALVRSSWLSFPSVTKPELSNVVSVCPMLANMDRKV